MAPSSLDDLQPQEASLQRFHVSATGHSLNYLPEYIAQRHGFFKEQGLEVTVSVPDPWDDVLDELANGTASAVLGGIWVPSMYRNRVKSYTAFAQVANRAPLALLKRGCSDGFDLSEVAGRTVLMRSGNGASIGLFFKMLLREKGVDVKSVDYIQDLNGPMLAKLFQGGMGDYLVIDNVSARAIAKANPDVSVAMEMVTDGDDIPWSVYYCETESMTSKALDAQKRFCVALSKGMDWVLQNDAESFQEELAELFPAAPIDVIVDLTNVYRHAGMWTTPLVTRHGYERWQRGIADGRLIKEPFAYEVIVNDKPATASRKLYIQNHGLEKTSGVELLSK